MSRSFCSARSYTRDLKVSSFLWALLVFVRCAGCAAPVSPRQAATLRVYYATTRAVGSNPTTLEKAFPATTTDQRYVRYGRSRVDVTSSRSCIVSCDPDVEAGSGLPRGKVNQKLLSQIDSDIIDASGVRSDLFGHSYDQSVLFEDLRALIRGKNLNEREHHTLKKIQPRACIACCERRAFNRCPQLLHP